MPSHHASHADARGTIGLAGDKQILRGRKQRSCRPLIRLEMSCENSPQKSRPKNMRQGFASRRRHVAPALLLC
jgi:hypothetical protein